MSEEKKLKARVVHKHKTAAEWYLDVYDDNGNLRDNPFVPLDGELIIFDPEEEGGQKRFKFGDGSTNVMDLPFIATLPKTQSSEEGSFLRIIGGEPTWSSVPAAETALF